MVIFISVRQLEIKLSRFIGTMFVLRYLLFITMREDGFVLKNLSIYSHNSLLRAEIYTSILSENTVIYTETQDIGIYNAELCIEHTRKGRGTHFCCRFYRGVTKNFKWS